MISAITGELEQIDGERIGLKVGQIVYELLIPASYLINLQAARGQEITFHTIVYMEGDPNRGNLEPRMIGFLSIEDKRFFQKFTTVGGIGTRKALKALTVPVGQIAAAIEARNARFLCELPQIGKRLAEQIIATLAGKVGQFATSELRPIATARTDEEEAAIALLLGPQIGLRRSEAELLLERVKRQAPNLKSVDELVPEMLRLQKLS